MRGGFPQRPAGRDPLALYRYRSRLHPLQTFKSIFNHISPGALNAKRLLRCTPANRQGRLGNALAWRCHSETKGETSGESKFVPAVVLDPQQDLFPLHARKRKIHNSLTLVIIAGKWALTRPIKGDNTGKLNTSNPMFTQTRHTTNRCGSRRTLHRPST